jgi:hypothetical protein
VRRKLIAAFLFLLAAGAIAFAVDYAVLRFRVRHGSGLGTLTVHPYYALHKRREKVDLIFADPEVETCVRSLFPHMGNRPCWYAVRHTDKRIDFY